MFHFVSSLEPLTPDLETEITAASAWVQITPTHTQKPTENAGALILESFSQLKNDIKELKESVKALSEQHNVMQQQLKAEAAARKEFDLIISCHVGKIKSILQEKSILEREHNILSQANNAASNLVWIEHPGSSEFSYTAGLRLATGFPVRNNATNKIVMVATEDSTEKLTVKDAQIAMSYGLAIDLDSIFQ